MPPNSIELLGYRTQGRARAQDDPGDGRQGRYLVFDFCPEFGGNPAFRDGAIQESLMDNMTRGRLRCQFRAEELEAFDMTLRGMKER